ncbi:TPA: hypothetical protein O5A76_000360 [Staphylococcus aureus]|nr:hypothetical protein [Staphylococcus aureus]
MGWGPNTEADEKSAYNNVKVGVGPQHREFRKEILQTMQVGVGPNTENFEKKFSSFAFIMVKLHRYKVIGKINNDFYKNRDDRRKAITVFDKQWKYLSKSRIK